MVKRTLIIIDTSYWLELFQVPNKSSTTHHAEIKKRFEQAIKQEGTSLFWPLPSVYETANHIAQVKDGHNRIKLARQLSRTVANSFEATFPLKLTPACELTEIQEF